MSASKGSQPNSTGHLPIPTGFRPAFFSSSSFPPPPRYQADKETRDHFPQSDLLSFQSPRHAIEERNRSERNAYVAILATQTLFERMTSAFVDAFAGPDGSSGFSGDKVAAVLSGKAKLGLVEVATPPPYVDNASMEGLGNSLGGLSIDSPSPAPTVTHSCGFDNVCKRWTGSSKKTEEF